MPLLNRNPCRGSVRLPMFLISMYSKSWVVYPAAISAGVAGDGLYIISVMRMEGARSTWKLTSSSGLHLPSFSTRALTFTPALSAMALE